MHDLMHDLAILVAGLMITTLDDDKDKNISKKTRHISIVGDDINKMAHVSYMTVGR